MPENNKSAPAESMDINYHVHEKLAMVSELKVREAMDAIIAVVQCESAQARGDGAKEAYTELARERKETEARVESKYKPLLEAAKGYLDGDDVRAAMAIGLAELDDNLRKPALESAKGE